jgi:hypothetical protein
MESRPISPPFPSWRRPQRCASAQLFDIAPRQPLERQQLLHAFTGGEFTEQPLRDLRVVLLEEQVWREREGLV